MSMLLRVYDSPMTRSGTWTKNIRSVYAVASLVMTTMS